MNNEKPQTAAEKRKATLAKKKAEAEAQNNFAAQTGGIGRVTVESEPVANFTEEEKRQRLLDIQLTTAILNQDAADEDNRRRKNERHQKSLQNAQRQSQLEAERTTRLRAARACNHRQGGMMTMGFSPSKGRGPTALNRIIMPDHRLIMCNAGCGLRLQSPHPYDQSTVVRKGETVEQMQARVAKYHRDLEYFEELWMRAETEAITPESAQIMDCGVEVKFMDRNGYEVLVRRQCDDYALKMYPSVA